ncbi:MULTISPECIES: TraX family protein [Caproicibacterium]|uniref:TraX family protein n=1 Tax=Caproicibacterium argilliputei TaxID=3030016 RepID=A0AA97DD96_9FIRM|nr:TraX family protein [Caproicibacterium argilliputei]WOC33400.1 TraX family protein [Caproicibacterium argilliputei]
MKTETFSAPAQRGLSASAIKWFAIACMLIDHIAWAFVPTLSAAGFALHAFGRITAPCMCFFLAEGYHYTHNVRKYLLRLGVFALLSWPCYSYFESGTLRPETGMIWTLFFSLLAILSYDRIQNTALRVLAIAGCIAATLLGDWPIFGVVFTLVFWIYRGDFKKQALGFILSALVCAAFFSQLRSMRLFAMQLCVLLALFPLALYNGRRGGETHPRLNKWAFYIFYPVHLLLLGLLEFPIS